MSYDLRIAVKVDGTNIFAKIAEPEHCNPTYNLADMFRACTGWDYNQSQYYRCVDVLPLIDHGIRELTINPDKYRKYNPPNGWGNLDSLKTALESLRQCIYETAEDIPVEHLWVAW